MNENSAIALATTLGSIAAIQYPWAAPLTAVAAFPIVELMKKRLKTAHAIALSEISEGRFNTIRDTNPEDFIAIAYRYHQAAQEGSANNNLRLLARLIEGTPELPPLSANEFLYYANVTSGLNPEELTFFGCLLRVEDMHKSTPRDKNESDVWRNKEAVQRQLVPGYIASQDDLYGVFAALSRTGFVMETAGMGGGEWKSTSAGRKVEQLARITDHEITTPY